MKDIPLRHVMYSSVKNILLTVIMTTAVLAMQASSIEERDAIRAARGLLMMQESSLPIAQTPLIEKHKSSTRKRKIEGDVPVQLTLKSTSDAAVIAELNNPAIKKPRIKAIFLRYLKAANHEILDLVLQRENGKLIKHHCKWQSNNAPCKGGALGQMAK